MKNYHEPSSVVSEAQITLLTEMFRQSWDSQTASLKSRDNWSEENKALGQCAVTALIVNDIFGGDLISHQPTNHIWNILPDGSEHDFSREQFLEETDFEGGVVVSRDELLLSEKAKTAQTPERYALLKKRVDTLRAKLGL